MAVARTIGPKLTQLVLYQDTASFYPAMITAIDRTTGNVSLTTFPPSGTASAQLTGVRYDFTGTGVGTWRYHETDVI